jgi:hypothetical protein
MLKLTTLIKLYDTIEDFRYEKNRKVKKLSVPD